MDIDFDSTMIFPNNCINVEPKIDEIDHGLMRYFPYTPYYCTEQKLNDLFWIVSCQVTIVMGYIHCQWFLNKCNFVDLLNKTILFIYRAIYMCSNGKKNFWEAYLLQVGLNDDNTPGKEQKSMSCKAKALKCFCAITDEETIATLTKVSYTEFL